MMKHKPGLIRPESKQSKSERTGSEGSTLVEFAIGATVFLTLIFGLLEFSHMLLIHNALEDAVRRGARTAVIRGESGAGAVKNVVVYGDAQGGTKPIVHGLTPGHVKVDYFNHGVNLDGKVTVSITDYKFKFIVPLFGIDIPMPVYTVTLPSESAGVIPCDYPTETPERPCN
jgi:hypothetical protein